MILTYIWEYLYNGHVHYAGYSIVFALSDDDLVFYISFNII